MPRKAEQVLIALADALQGLPSAALRNEPLPTKIPPTGLVILHDGVPGEPEVTLSPLTYHYQHRAELDVFSQFPKGGRDETFDDICVALAGILAGDRTLGGLCDWVEAEAPEPSELPMEGADGVKAAIITIVLHYSTADPLN